MNTEKHPERKAILFISTFYNDVMAKLKEI